MTMLHGSGFILTLVDSLLNITADAMLLISAYLFYYVFIYVFMFMPTINIEYQCQHYSPMTFKRCKV